MVQQGMGLSPAGDVAAMVPARTIRPEPIPSPGVGHNGAFVPTAAVQRRNFPKHDQSERARPPLVGTPWKTEVGPTDILNLLGRNGLAFRSLTKIAHTAARKYRLKSDDEELEDQLRETDQRLDMPKVIENGTALSKGLGFCALGIGWIESPQTSDDPTQDPMNITGVEYVQAIPRTSIPKIWVEKVMASENYGEITHYTLLMPDGDEEVEVKLPASRFIHWKNPFIDDRPEGISQLVPAFNYFVALEELTQAAGAIPKRVGSPIPTLQYPSDVGRKELSDAKMNFKNLTWAKQFMFPEGYEFNMEATNIALDLRPYYEFILTLISAALTGSKFALLGAEQGTQSTSTTNLMEWYNFIASLQENYIEPIIREFYRTLQAAGVIKEGEFKIEFDPLFELDAKEKADVQLVQVTALDKLADVMKKFREEGFTVDVTDGEVSFAMGDSVFSVPAVQSSFQFRTKRVPPGRPLSTRPGAPPAMPQSWVKYGITASGQSMWLPQSELDKVYDDWHIDITDVEQSTSSTMVLESIRNQAEIYDAFRKAWTDNNMGETNDTRLPAATPAAVPSTQTEAGFFAAIDSFTAQQSDEFIESLIKFLNRGYVEGIGQTTNHFDDVTFTAEQLSDPDTLEAITRRGTDLGKNMYLKNKNGAVQIMRDGVDQGHGYDRIKRDVGTFFKKTNEDNIPNTVGKYLNTVKAEGRKSVMDELEIDTFRIVTAGDTKVRTKHSDAANRLKPLTWSETQDIVNDYGCRCTYVPVTVLDQVAADYGEAIREAEAVAEEAVAA